MVKRSISAGGFETTLERGQSLAEKMIPELQFAGEEIMIQSFCPEIQTEGEWSLVFFNGHYSHAVLKTAGQGEFRVQEKLGGTVRGETASIQIISMAQEIVKMCPEIPLYARVDGIVRGKSFLLMELEVLEPSLFFAQCPGSEKAFANGILERSSYR